MAVLLDDRPDLSTLRAFIASAAQGVVYDTGIWHHPLICLETVREYFLIACFDAYDAQSIDFACVETQIGGHSLDCEIVELEPVYPRVEIPKF
jgi:allantoicase